jgi:two-component system response regulator AtoC
MARVLVADDDEGVRAFLADALELDGHEVVAVADGRAAAETLRRTAFHVLLSDVRMPHVDGMALLAQVRERHPDVEVVMLTAHGNVEMAVQAMRLGATDFLCKPVGSLTELRQVVARAAERCLCRARAELRVDAPPVLSWGDPSMVGVVEALRRVALTDATVLLLGETGTGKEVAARALHLGSRRARGPFVALSCASIPDQLLESELFGHERGAFTGADARRRGRIEQAEGGTLFLDEIGELRLDLQAKLLRVLQERSYERVGGEQTQRADVRWVAATHRDLPSMVREGRFREDLYWRLNSFPVRLPPLRERRSDIVPIARALLLRVAADLRRPPLQLDAAAERALQRRTWRGNIRELANALERAAILTDGPVIGDRWLVDQEATEAGTLDDVERAAIVEALARCGGHRKQAAEALGIAERTLYDKLKRFGLS